jgi:hypothetical protein
MSHILEADLCVIGAGSGGLSVAAGRFADGSTCRAHRARPNGRRVPRQRLRAIKGAH